MHSTIKLDGKIKDKRDIYLGLGGKKYPYSSLEHVAGKPFVIAVAPFDSDTSLMQNNELINRILFEIDMPDSDSLVTGGQREISSITKKTGSEVPLGIFTNDSYKEVSAVIFSTTGTFGKAQLESRVEKIVRSTRYRRNDDKSSGLNGMRNQVTIENANLMQYHYMVKTRFNIQGDIFGSDINICHSRFHRETHLDGLHIYYNPYAEYPLDKNVFSAPEITHNFYDVAKKMPIQEHPDGALVSRELYDFNESNYKVLLLNHSVDVLSKNYKSYFG